MTGNSEFDISNLRVQNLILLFSIESENFTWILFYDFDANSSDDEKRNFLFFSPFSSIFCFSVLFSCYSFLFLFLFFFKREEQQRYSG